MEKATLIIMAAGIGSRFGGGIKQLEPVGPNGEIILEYSIYDAIQAGFDRVVFVIREELASDFKKIIGNKINGLVKVEYVYQKVDEIPIKFIGKFPDRTKPWGTGQAVLCCDKVIQGPFVVINADDYYGKEAFAKAFDHLTTLERKSDKLQVCMIGFVLGNTLSKNGGVTRGICKVDDMGNLKEIKETYNILKSENGAVICNGKDKTSIDVESIVSMNMWGFPGGFMQVLQEGFSQFLEGLDTKEKEKEYLLPIIVNNLLGMDRIDVKVLKSSDKWFGVTYKEDKINVSREICTLVSKGAYPYSLFVK